jgi:hypothetical protein
VVFTSMGSLLWICVTFSTYRKLPASILKSPLFLEFAAAVSAFLRKDTVGPSVFPE